MGSKGAVGPPLKGLREESLAPPSLPGWRDRGDFDGVEYGVRKAMDMEGDWRA